MNNLINFLLIIAYFAFAAIAFGFAARDFSNKKFYWFGVDLVIGMIFVAVVIYSNDKLQNMIRNPADHLEVLALVIVLTWHIIIWPIDIVLGVIRALNGEET